MTALSDPMREAGRLYRAGRFDEAERLAAEELRLRPDQPAALHMMGLLHKRRGRLDQAMALFERVVALAPADGAAYAQLGYILRRQGKPEPAAERFRQCIERSPDHLDVGLSLAALLLGAGRDAAAVPVLEALRRYHPGSAELLHNLGIALKRLGRDGEAIAAFEEAVRLAPAQAGTWFALAGACLTRGQSEQAAQAFERVVALDPGHFQACLQLALLRKRQDRSAEAVALFDAAAALAPGELTPRLGRCMARLPMFYEDTAALSVHRAAYAADLEAVAAGPDPADPALREAAAMAIGSFQPYYLPYQEQCDRPLQEIYGGLVTRVMAARYPHWAETPPMPPAPPGEPLRIGFLSGFFRWHTIWKLFLRGWMQGLDRRRFSLHAYSTFDTADATTAEARAGFDSFVEGQSFEAMCRRIREDRLHALIFPEIGMDPAAIRFAGLKLAPLQYVSWGHPDTTGLATIDGFLTSALMEPDGAEAHYSEELIRLPGLGIGYPPLAVAERPVDFRALGLRPEAVVYLCCQYLPKYLPRYDHVFAGIAKAVPDSQFVFIDPRSADMAERLLRRLGAAFAAEGLDAARHVVMVSYLQPGEYAALNRRADVYLDSIGWSGGNTTLEAVANGLPVVTLPGGLMRGRHSAAILAQIGLEETVARDLNHYVALAVELGTDAGRRRALGAEIATRAGRIYADTRPLRALEEVLESRVRMEMRSLHP
ncbi:MAG: tetratricopeptide repeat protein [Rhodospirillales bacterium]|nr:tetratricopeptide repeat protein [Rhodospirillales bacterium]